MDALEKARQRSVQYWFEDGLMEIGLGVFFGLLGVYFLLGSIIPSGSLWRIILDSSFLVVFVGGVWLVSRGIRWAKEKFIYPRTGYIAYAQKKRSPRWIAAIISAIAGAVFAAIFSQGNLIQWLPAFIGIVFCLVMVFIAAKVNLVRFYLLAIAALGIGVLASTVELGASESNSAVYGLFGFVLLISGICSLFQYLRRYSSTEATPHE